MLNIIINASNASRFFSYPVRFTSLFFSFILSHASVERLRLPRPNFFPSLSFTSCCIAIRHSRACMDTQTHTHTHTHTHTYRSYIIYSCKIIYHLTHLHTCSTWLDNHLKFSLSSLNERLRRIVNSFFFFLFFLKSTQR